ncbi:MAG: class I SAM-dependent methyltransferase, partial [Nitrospirae bacterium]|nr:class I SAM-dependent methyltransferase [Nitrospirota bacterium]
MKKLGVLNKAFYVNKLTESLIFEYISNPSSDMIILMGGDHHLYFLHDSDYKKDLWHKVKIPTIVFCYESILESKFPNSIEKTVSAINLFTHFIYCDEIDKLIFEKYDVPSIWLPQCVDHYHFYPINNKNIYSEKLFFKGKTSRSLFYDLRIKILQALIDNDLVDYYDKEISDYELMSEYQRHLYSINLPSNFGGFNTRTFEALASKNILFQDIIKNRPKNNELFKDGIDIIYYDPYDPNCIKNLIERILEVKKNFNDYKKIAENGYNNCLSNHTIEKRIQQIVKFVEDTYTSSDRLHLGCGENVLPGFLNVDIRKINPYVFVDDVSSLNSLPDKSFSLIYASHILEHFPRDKVIDILRKWISKLKEGGEIYISVPDFEYLCKKYLETKRIEDILPPLFGGQDYKENFHFNAFDEVLLSKCLKELGLVNISKFNPFLYNFTKKDCARWELSLNVKGQKPIKVIQDAKKTVMWEDIKMFVLSIPGLLAPGQEEFLFNKVNSLQDDAIIVEIGSYKGRSTVAMGYACKGTKRRIYCIDTWDGNETDFQERNFYDVWQENIRKNGIEKHVTPLKGNSHYILSRWDELTNGKMIDFIFIDGSHRFLDVLKDFEMTYPFIKKGGLIAFHDVVHSWPGPERLWNDIAKYILENHEYCSTLACGQKIKEYNLRNKLPFHFLTIVLNGERFIRHHIEVFKQLPFKWHWHIIEGVADLKHDTAWSLQFGARITDEIHKNGLSNDGTTEYLDDLKKQYPDNITIYRKEGGKFWDGKLEMVNAPLKNINEECLLWQIDADELWTVEQICAAQFMFLQNPEKTAAFYFCHYFVGEDLVITTRDTYGNHTNYEWIRTWRYKPGDKWIAHEPPKLCRKIENDWIDIASINPFRHGETEERGMIFQHYAYAIEKQLAFKEFYFGYKGATSVWKQLQKVNKFPVYLRDYFPWVKDTAQVNTTSSIGIRPVARKNILGHWKFRQYEIPSTEPSNILFIRTDSIGDNVLAMSMLPYIRQKYPYTKITVLCQKHIAELYESCPHIDEIITFDRIRCYQDESYRNEILAKVQALNSDIALNSVYSREPLTDFFTIGSNAKERIGFKGDHCNIQPQVWAENNKYYSKLLETEVTYKTELERHRDFLKGLGIEAPQLQPIIWLTPEDEKFAEEFFRENKLDPEKTIALFTGVQQNTRFYEYYGEALKDALKDEKFTLIAFGAAEDRAINQSNLDATRMYSINLSGELTIRQTAALMKKCRLAVGAETGLAHIACAVGIFNIILLGGGQFGRFMPFSFLTSVVCLPLECYKCSWYCKYHRVYCIRDILPEVFSYAISQTLNSQSNKPRVFVQGKSLWNPKLGEPQWKWFDRFLDINSVEIIPVGEVPEIPERVKEKESMCIQSNILEEIQKINSLMNIQKFSEAEGVINEALQKFPDSPELLNEQAVLKIKQGDKQGAKEILLKITKINQSFYPAYNNLACLYCDEGDFENATRYFEEALKITKSQAIGNRQQATVAGYRSVVMGYGEMLMSLKKYAKAKELFDEYLKANPEDSEV